MPCFIACNVVSCTRINIDEKTDVLGFAFVIVFWHNFCDMKLAVGGVASVWR